MKCPQYIKVDNKKYKINTDFRVAIECNKIATDETIDDFERALAIIYKLFGEEALQDTKNLEKFLELARKYLCCGKELEDTNEEPDMDYIEDYDYIVASFQSDFGINLDEEQMDWYRFNKLMNGLSNSELGNCCVLNRVRNLRNFDTSEIENPKERRKIEKAKKQVALNNNKKENHLTKEQEQSMEELNKILGF